MVTDAISRIIQGSKRVQNHQMLAHLSYTRICFAVGVGTGGKLKKLQAVEHFLKRFDGTCAPQLLNWLLFFVLLMFLHYHVVEPNLRLMRTLILYPTQL